MLKPSSDFTTENHQNAAEKPLLQSPFSVGPNEGKAALAQVRELNQHERKVNVSFSNTDAPEKQPSVSDAPAKPAPSAAERLKTLPPEVQEKVVQEWGTRATDIVNQYRKSQGQEPLKTTGDEGKDWEQLSKAIEELPKKEKEKVLIAYYESMNKVLKDYNAKQGGGADPSDNP